MAVSFTQGTDYVIPSRGGQTYLGVGGDDVYILSSSTIESGATIVISDTEGDDLIQLVDGLEISASQVISNAVELTLSNDARIQILGADRFLYDVGGNATIGTTGVVEDFDTFVSNTLGISDPDTLQEDAYSRSVTIAGIDQDSLISMTDPIAAALYEGDSWLDLQGAADPITYSFNETLPPEYTGSDTRGWAPVADSVRDVIHEVMAAADGVILPDIEPVDDDGLIRFNAATMDEGIAGYAYYPGTGRGGDVFLDHEVGTDTANGNIDPYGYGRSTIVHELGHALGLVHPFEGVSTLPVADDHTANTVMSYTNYRLKAPVFTGTKTGSGSEVSVTDDFVSPDHFMPYDIAVLQAVYGPDTDFQVSDDTYVFDTTPFYTTVWDAGGFDSLDFSATTHYNDIDLTPGSHSHINYRDLDTQIAEQQAVYRDQLDTGYFDDWVADTLTGRQDDLYTGENALGIAYGTVIEAVTGGPAGNRFVDNSADNYLTGGAGDDLFYLGSGGFDRIDGNGGYDLVMLEGYDSDQVEMGSYDGAFLLVADGFALEMVDVAGVQFADQLYVI
jgi:hypothetical protein